MVDETDYYRVLQHIHNFLRPRTYLEVGVRHGESWRLARRDTQSIGIDPNARISHQIVSNGFLFQGTSDQYFSQHDTRGTFGGLPVDLSFVDGMHHFEFALRDFINLERLSSGTSLILLHDCLPIDEETSTREMKTFLWSGDIWKVIICLRRERPDLQIDVFDTGPTGLAVIQNLDPSNDYLLEHFHSVEASYKNMPYSVLGDEHQKREMLNVCSADFTAIERICGPQGRFGTVRSCGVDSAARLTLVPS